MNQNLKRPARRLRRQLRGIYTYQFVSCLDIVGAVWVALLAARGYSLWQIGLAEGVHHIVGLMVEVPSGMAADLLGRKRTLALSGVMAAISGLTMALERGFGFVLVSMAFAALSYNLISGTMEALTYDSLCEADRTDLYPTVQTRCAWLLSAGGFAGRAASALTALLSFTKFYLLDMVLGFARSLSALCLREPVVTETQAARQAADARTLLVTLPAGCGTMWGPPWVFWPGGRPWATAAGQRPDRSAQLPDPDVFAAAAERGGGIHRPAGGADLPDGSRAAAGHLAFAAGAPPAAAFAVCRVCGGGRAVYRRRRAGAAAAGPGGQLRVCRHGDAVEPLQRTAAERRLPQRPAGHPGERGQPGVQPADDPGVPLTGLAGDITGRAGAGLALLGGALLAVGAAAAAKLLLYKRRGVRYNKK